MNGSSEEVKESAKEPTQPPPMEELRKSSDPDLMGLLLPEDKVNKRTRLLMWFFCYVLGGSTGWGQR